MNVTIDMDKAKGVMLGQMCGDALGGTIEFTSAASNKAKFPNGHREIIGKGPFRLKPGQVTDDTELALGMARVLASKGYDIDEIARAYVAWKRSGPFDCGGTCGNAFSIFSKPLEKVTAKDLKTNALRRKDSQANGALMRISPMAIYCWNTDVVSFVDMVMEDSKLSHVHQVCQVSNAVFCEAIRWCLRGKDPNFAATRAIELAKGFKNRAPIVYEVLWSAYDDNPLHDGAHGWVLNALKLAFWHFVRIKDDSRDPQGFEDSLSSVVMHGGDADTNGAIAGALLGSWYGFSGIPKRWTDTVLGCETGRGPTYQCTDALELVEAIVHRGEVDPVDSGKISV